MRSVDVYYSTTDDKMLVSFGAKGRLAALCSDHTWQIRVHCYTHLIRQL